VQQNGDTFLFSYFWECVAAGFLDSSEDFSSVFSPFLLVTVFFLFEPVFVCFGFAGSYLEGNGWIVVYFVAPVGMLCVDCI
jgi:hypothetical protein